MFGKAQLRSTINLVFKVFATCVAVVLTTYIMVEVRPSLALLQDKSELNSLCQGLVVNRSGVEEAQHLFQSRHFEVERSSKDDVVRLEAWRRIQVPLGSVVLSADVHFEQNQASRFAVYSSGSSL